VTRFRRGLVVGKFAPLHRGHEALIRHALSSCDEVLVISYSKPEFPGCDARRRSQWLAEVFPSVRTLVVTDEALRPGTEFAAVPENDAPASVHRDFCAFLCETHLESLVDAVFTSEDYGDDFAKHLTKRFRRGNSDAPVVSHVSVDRDRLVVPISGSTIRKDVHAHRHWLSPCVYASFVKRICTLGGESSGKTTLARALAERFNTACVAEYGRELWEAKAGNLVYDDLLAIGRRQVELELSAAQRGNRYVFCDTSPLTTLFYSLDMFGRADPALETLSTRSYDLHILCAPDFEFVQDGTRRDAQFRQRQHEWYLEKFATRNTPYLLAERSLEARVDQVYHALHRMEQAPE
jgi:HTH-type transcriptional regulator, transcriptional repressor of NAD biosynthesis genes